VYKRASTFLQNFLKRHGHLPGLAPVWRNFEFKPVKPSRHRKKRKDGAKPDIRTACRFCGRKFFKEGYIRHVKNVHPDRWESFLFDLPPIEHLGKDTLYRCRVCGVLVKKMKRHLRECHPLVFHAPRIQAPPSPKQKKTEPEIKCGDIDLYGHSTHLDKRHNTDREVMHPSLATLRNSFCIYIQKILQKLRHYLLRK